jgi:uncharacterized protein YgfB (UPF0149 family)
VDRPELPPHDAVTSELARLQLGADASELHGSLCGFLSAHGDLSRRDWLQRLEVEPDPIELPPDGVLDQLYFASRAQLGDPDLGFALLLPDDEQPVDERAEALLGWCRGFLGGFGLAGKRAEALSAEAREALEDLGKIAASQLSYDEPETDETALTEVSEFVRVATLLLHGDGLDDDDAGAAPRRVH